MKIGYARVSSLGQKLETQIAKLEQFGCERIFQDKKSGATSKQRPGVQQAIEFCREGDTLVITKLDRLARSVFDLQKIMAELARKKVDFIVLDQQIDTTTPTGRLTFHLLGAVAEFERDLINERRDEGMVEAKKRGVQFGRRFKLSKKQRAEVVAEYRKGAEKVELREKYRISKSTLDRMIKADREGS